MTDDLLEIPDVILIRQMADGDAAAFARFYHRHSTLLFSIAIHVLGDREEAEDTLQDAARTIWERAPNYEASLGRPSSWAVVITRNKAIDRLRAQQRRSERIAFVARVSADSANGHANPASNVAIGNETSESLRAALAALPVPQRTAIELAFFGGLSQSEIADRLGEPLGTIKARIRRGMMTLRDALEETL